MLFFVISFLFFLLFFSVKSFILTKVVKLNFDFDFNFLDCIIDDLTNYFSLQLSLISYLSISKKFNYLKLNENLIENYTKIIVIAIISLKDKLTNATICQTSTYPPCRAIKTTTTFSYPGHYSSCFNSHDELTQRRDDLKGSIYPKWVVM